MRDDLMTVKIEVDPLGGAPPLRTAEQPAVEAPRSFEVVDGEGEVEGMKIHLFPNVIASIAKQSRRRFLDCFVANSSR
jgi:hypothetical protein